MRINTPPKEHALSDSRGVAGQLWFRWFTDIANWVAAPQLPTSPPATASDAGREGEIRYDANYVYVCIAANTWKRAALSTW
jgi:hypothetical protein